MNKKEISITRIKITTDEPELPKFIATKGIYHQCEEKMEIILEDIFEILKKYDLNKFLQLKIYVTPEKIKMLDIYEF